MVAISDFCHVRLSGFELIIYSLSTKYINIIYSKTGIHTILLFMELSRWNHPIKLIEFLKKCNNLNHYYSFSFAFYKKKKMPIKTFFKRFFLCVFLFFKPSNFNITSIINHQSSIINHQSSITNHLYT